MSAVQQSTGAHFKLWTRHICTCSVCSGFSVIAPLACPPTNILSLSSFFPVHPSSSLHHICCHAEYVLEFQKCLDRTDPVPFSTIRGIIQQELRGRSVESIFSYINPEPLASASVAQVAHGE